MTLKSKLREITESTSVALVMLLVLLPVRLLFVRYISDNWLGSFGLITIISVVILVLARKNKLGWFGRAFHSQMYKVHRGKRRYFIYFNLIIGLIFLSGTIYAIEVGKTQYQQEVMIVKEALPSDNMREIMEETQREVQPADIPKGIFLLIFSFILRFDLFAILMTTMNDLTDGWVLHFATVFLVEELEIIGLLIFYRFTIKKQEMP